MKWQRNPLESFTTGHVVTLRVYRWLGGWLWTAHGTDCVDGKACLVELGSGTVSTREGAEAQAEEAARGWFQALPESQWWATETRGST